MNQSLISRFLPAAIFRRHFASPQMAPPVTGSNWRQLHILGRRIETKVNSSVPVLSARRQHQTDLDRRTTALTVISDLKHLRHSPAPALTLGLGGLVPFVGAPAYMIMTQNYCRQMAQAQLLYGACILSFLGGVRWGLTLPNSSTVAPNWFNLLYSVTPSLVAWVGLLLPYPGSTLTVLGGLCGAAYMDLTMPGYPSWFKALRFLLTFVAVLSLWTTITVKFLLENNKNKSMKTVASESEEHNQQPLNNK